MLRFENFGAGYGTAVIFEHLSLEVREGEITVLLGRNGAGKTTLLKSILGVEAQRWGTLELAGTDISRMATEKIVRLGVGYVPDDRRIYPFTVRENLELALRRRGADTDARIQEICQVVPLIERLLDQQGDKTSGGEQQAVAVARALMSDPRLLLVDEASEGLAPVIVQELITVFGRLRDRGATVLMAEQNVAFVRAVADRILVMDRGLIRFDGSVEEFDRTGLDELVAI